MIPQLLYSAQQSKHEANEGGTLTSSGSTAVRGWKTDEGWAAAGTAWPPRPTLKRRLSPATSWCRTQQPKWAPRADNRLRAEEATSTNSCSTATGRDRTSTTAESPSHTHCVSYAEVAIRDPPPRHRDKPDSKAVCRPPSTTRPSPPPRGRQQRDTSTTTTELNAPPRGRSASASAATPQRCLHGPARRAVLDQPGGDRSTADQSRSVAEPIYPARRRGLPDNRVVEPCRGERKNLPVDVWLGPATTPPVNHTPIRRKQGPRARVLGLPGGVSVQAAL